MTQIIIVVPGKRAGRRLEEVLVSSSQTQGLAPPQIITAGELPEKALPTPPADRPTAPSIISKSANTPTSPADHPQTNRAPTAHARRPAHLAIPGG